MILGSFGDGHRQLCGTGGGGGGKEKDEGGGGGMVAIAAEDVDDREVDRIRVTITGR